MSWIGENMPSVWEVRNEIKKLERLKEAGIVVIEMVGEEEI